MPYVHEFGIIESIENYEDGKYEPKKYKCISIDGEFVDEIYSKGFGDKMKALKTFVNNINSPYNDLAYYGITLIPPSSLKQFLSIIIEENSIYKSKELEELVNKISQAMNESKWMIHYGI